MHLINRYFVISSLDLQRCVRQEVLGGDREDVRGRGPASGERARRSRISRSRGKADQGGERAVGPLP